MKHGIAALLLLTLCASSVAQSPGSASFPPEQIQRGATLYAANCESCHGVRMIGSLWAIDLAPFRATGPIVLWIR